MNKKIWKIIFVILVVLAIIFAISYIIKTKKNSQKSNTNLENNMNVVLSLEDEITDNTAWCGTFNLIWNDLKNDLAKQDIIFTPQLEVVKNLNKGTFNTSYLSEDSYYKTYGVPTLKLKEEIEKAIKEKFNETSDILDDFSWDNTDSKNYFLYTMLKKEFEFPKVFTKLEDGTFGKYEKNVKYFGINSSTDRQVRNQVEVLYYNSKEDFAIKLITNSNDEVIISRGNNKNTFLEIYNDIQENNKNYNGNKELGENDKVQIPNIDLNLKKEFEELENKSFLFSNGDEYEIEKTLQTIKFSLDEKGGKIKSEAGIMTKGISAINPDEPREFLVDDTFCIFLKEKDKELPYFAAKVSDISKVQNND